MISCPPSDSTFCMSVYREIITKSGVGETGHKSMIQVRFAIFTLFPRNISCAALRLAIELLAVFSQDTTLRDIEPEIVRKYDLKTVRRVNRMQ